MVESLKISQAARFDKAVPARLTWGRFAGAIPASMASTPPQLVRPSTFEEGSMCRFVWICQSFSQSGLENTNNIRWASSLFQWEQSASKLYFVRSTSNCAKRLTCRLERKPYEHADSRKFSCDMKESQAMARSKPVRKTNAQKKHDVKHVYNIMVGTEPWLRSSFISYRYALEAPKRPKR